MKEKTKTVYYCEHCNKHSLVRHTIPKHEIKCSNNPDNYRPCYTCIHSEVGKRELMDYEQGIRIPSGMMQKTFTCTRFKNQMYGHVVEVLGLRRKYPEDFEDITAMPKECDDFQDTYSELRENQ